MRGNFLHRDTVIILLAGAIGISSILLYQHFNARSVVVYTSPPKSELKAPAAPDANETLQAEEESVEESESSLPDKVLIRVPFSPQSPFAEWHIVAEQEGCEEASLIMVKHFLDEKPLSPEQAKEEIHELVAWEMEEFGYHIDTSIEEVKKMAEEYYGLSATIYWDPSIEDIKEQLAKGNPAIIPVAGRDLENKYFTPPGPLYHMLVITGYGGKNFITNDPGTKEGEGYEYRIETIMNALHDWTGVKEDIHSGRPAMLIVETT